MVGKSPKIIKLNEAQILVSMLHILKGKISPHSAPGDLIAAVGQRYTGFNDYRFTGG